MRMIAGDKQREGFLPERVVVRFDPDGQELASIPTIDRQYAVRRHFRHGLGKIEIVGKGLALLPLCRALLTDQPCRLLVSTPQNLPQVTSLAEAIGQDVAGTRQGVKDRGNVTVGIGILRRAVRQIGTRRIRREDLVGQLFKTAAAGLFGQRLPLGSVGQIQVLEPFDVREQFDLVS